MTAWQDHATVIHSIKLCSNLWDIKDNSILQVQSLITQTKSLKHKFDDYRFNVKKRDKLIAFFSMKSTKDDLRIILDSDMSNISEHLDIFVRKFCTIV